jgi:glycosyltransferase involved in cell wall biosynthesis
VVSVPDLGWSTYAQSLRRVTDTDDEIDAVHVICPASHWERLAGAKIAGRGLGGYLDSHYRRHFVHQLGLRRLLKRSVEPGRFDVVHVSPHLFAGAVHDVLGAIPMSVSMDSTVIQAKENRHGTPPEIGSHRHRKLIEFERASLDAASGVVCFSEWAASGLREEYGRVDDVIVVSPALEPPVRRGTHDVGDPIRIVFVGNEFVRKGGDRLLRWHQALLSDRVELHICSAQAPSGDGLHNVVVHGATPHDELVDTLLPSMDLFVLPTRSDQSPWVVVEAINAGVPVIASAVGGVAELIPDGAGIALDANDDDGFVQALVGFISDHDGRRRMIAAAAARDVESEWRSSCSRLTTMWKDLA